MAEPSLTESFIQVACCDTSTAQRYLQNSAGDMGKAMARYFRDQDHHWDAPGSAGHQAPRTQPVGCKGEYTDVERPPVKDKGEECTVVKPLDSTVDEEEEVGIPPVGHKAGFGKRPADQMAEDDADDLDHLDPTLPWNKVKFGQPALPGGKEEFAYDAIKTKVQMTNFAGPKDGSTWHWFLVADQKVFPAGDAAGPPPNNGANGHGEAPVKEASTYITGDKFQAGWACDPGEKVSETVMGNRKASMLESVLQGKVNAYGKNRRGCKPGYSHRWTYADSEWGDKAGGKPVQTTETFWDEQKNEDRWLVSVQMQWNAPSKTIVPGSYVIVADQTASKMNKNQYTTAMRGHRYRIGSLDTPPDKLAAAKHSLLSSILTGMRATPAKSKSITSPKKKQKKVP